MIPHALGSLCPKKHDHGGGSLRYLVNGQPIGSCVDCGRAANNAHRKALRAARQAQSVAQGRDDGKYLGPVCARGHAVEGGSLPVRLGLRYVRDGSCVECDAKRNKNRRESPGGKSYERARKRRENVARATAEFTDPDLRAERERTYQAESKLRDLRKKVKHGRKTRHHQ